MMRDDAEDLLAHVVAVDGVNVEPIEDGSGGSHARLLVIDRSDPSVDESRGRRFPQIVADGTQHHDDLPRMIEVVDSAAGLVDHHERVDPDISFGVPFRLLLASHQRVDLREHAADDAQVEREREAG